LLVQTLDGIEDGTLEAREQSEEWVSYAPKITVEDARVDWSEPAVAVDRRIRAVTPGPGAWSTFAGERIKLGPVRHVDPQQIGQARLEPGALGATKNAVFVGTATEAVQLGRVKAFGKKEMDAADWARGVRLESGAHFGE
jgi:methionyl-tRNA formyltransferase